MEAVTAKGDRRPRPAPRAHGPLRVWTAVAPIVLTAASAAGQAPGGTAPAAAVHTLTVLPFTNAAGEAADRWIGAGIAETLEAELAADPGTAIIPAAEVARANRSAAGADLPPGDVAAALRICRMLGIRWLVAGDYQRIADRLRITARLVAVETGEAAHWMKLDGPFAELFDLQDDLAEALARYLAADGGRAPRAARPSVAAPRFPELQTAAS